MGPTNYNPQDSFNQIKKSPCAVRLVRDMNLDSGSESYTLVNGNQKVYNRAFEMHKDKKLFDDIVQDDYIATRAPIPMNMKNDKFKNILSHMSRSIREDDNRGSE